MDFYVILGVERNATAQEIRRAYRRLARRFHPDINPGDAAAQQRYRQIVEAFDTLTDPLRRHDYDASGQTVMPTAAAFAFEGFDFDRHAEGEGASTFGELFADVLTRAVGQGPALGPEYGADLHGAVSLTFDESMHGARRLLTVTRLESCAACRGAGRVPAVAGSCAVCKGAGRVRGSRGHMVFSRPCPACQGAGEHRERACGACMGEGVHPVTETIDAVTPPGVAAAAVLRVLAKGNAGRRGGRHGDLLIHVDVEPHPLFRRDGLDLHLEAPVAVYEAALGAKIEVPTPYGPCKVRIPPGTQSGQRLRVRERGVLASDPERRGDLIVEVRLVLPPLVDERARELMRELARLHPENVRQHLGISFTSGEE